jgi:hypothetical protein
VRRRPLDLGGGVGARCVETFGFARALHCTSAAKAVKNTDREGPAPPVPRPTHATQTYPPRVLASLVHCADAQGVPGSARKGGSKELRDGRDGALGAAIAQIESSYGVGTVMRLGERVLEAHPVVSTGSLLLDGALGIGGLPKGRVVEVYGYVCSAADGTACGDSSSYLTLQFPPLPGSLTLRVAPTFQLCRHSGHGVSDGVSTGPAHHTRPYPSRAFTEDATTDRSGRADLRRAARPPSRCTWWQSHRNRYVALCNHPLKRRDARRPAFLERLKRRISVE